MTNNFIKVVSPEVAEKLVARGFQYIKEQNTFVFPYSEELVSILQSEYQQSQFVRENKLRF